MEREVAMAGKWKHGYVPLDLAAAMEKAHGSKSGAAKALTSAKRTAKPQPKKPPKVVNRGGRNMSTLSSTPEYQVKSGAKPRMPDVLAPGVKRGPGSRTRRSK
jgi:hypothetical protein